MKSIDYTTVRWKINNDIQSLSEGDISVLNDLLKEKIGFGFESKPETEEQSTTEPSSEYKEIFTKSPNQSGKISPKFIILHDSCGAHDGTRSWILQSKSKVSYHYLIASDGSLTQFVGDTKKAWHAGKSNWKGLHDMNSHSIGIAFWGDTHKRIPSDVEIDSCAHKCIYLMDKFNLGIEAIITHQMIAPGRKTDTAPETHKKVLDRIREIWVK